MSESACEATLTRAGMSRNSWIIRYKYKKNPKYRIKIWLFGLNVRYATTR